MNAVAQMDLFGQPIIPAPSKFGTIQERFEHFHRQNPHVYLAFVYVAREWLAETGAEHVGAKAVWEQVRWRFSVRTKTPEDYNLNNSFVSRYARLAAAQEPDLAGVFRMRELRAA